MHKCTILLCPMYFMRMVQGKVFQGLLDFGWGLIVIVKTSARCEAIAEMKQNSSLLIWCNLAIVIKKFNSCVKQIRPMKDLEVRNKTFNLLLKNIKILSLCVYLLHDSNELATSN
jgi:hypothetical protein